MGTKHCKVTTLNRLPSKGKDLRAQVFDMVEESEAF